MPILVAHSGGRAVAATTSTTFLFHFCFWKYTSLLGHGSGTTALLRDVAAVVLPHEATEAATARRRGPQASLPYSAYRAYGASLDQKLARCVVLRPLAGHEALFGIARRPFSHL